MFPSSSVLSGELEDLGPRPLKSSGSADIYKATYRGRAVAVKALKTLRTQTPEYTHKVRIRRFVSAVNFIYWIFQRLVKEVVGWAWLRHENIVPFIGIATQPTRFSIVSEWIPNGDIMSFIARNPGQNLFPLVS